MLRQLFARSIAGRWAVAASVLLGLLALAQLVQYEQQQSRWLGMHAERQGDSLVLSWVQASSWAWDSAALVGYEVLVIDDQIVSAETDPERVTTAQNVVLRAADGSVVAVSSDVWPDVDISPMTSLIYTLTAALFVGLSCVVFVLAADLLAAGLLLVLAVSVALMFEAVFAQPSGVAWSFNLAIVAIDALGASTLLFFLVFPINRLSSRGGRWALRACIATNAVLLLCAVWVLGAAPNGYAILKPVMLLVMLVELLAAIALVVVGLVRWSPERRAARRALGVVAIGAAAGLAPLSILSLAPYVLGGSYVVPAYMTILSLGLLPVSLGIALLSRQFLGIERLLRRGLVGLLVWLGLVAVYRVGLDSPLLSVLPSQMQPVGTTIYLAFAMTTFPVLQARLRRLVERVLFRDVYDYQSTLQHVGNTIAGVSGLDAIAGHALAELAKTLDLSWAGILLRVPGESNLRVFLRGASAPNLDRGIPEAVLNHEPEQLIAEARRAGIEIAHLTPLVAEGVRVGLLAIGPKHRDVDLLSDDQALVMSMVPVLANALDHALLVARLEAQVQALAGRERDLANLNVRLMQVQEEERRRLALELHDDPLQQAVLLTRALTDLERKNPTFGMWRGAASDIVVALRAICSGLRPPMLDDLGLPDAAEWLATNLRARSELEISFEVATADGLSFGRLDPGLELALYRVAQEALNNTLKHAEATRAEVWLTRDADSIRLRVADDGRGLPVNGDGPSPTSLGLLGMRERLAAWNATVSIDNAIGGGVEVSAWVPLPSEDGNDPGLAAAA